MIIPSFFVHRYGAHRMFVMSRGWEKFFHLFAVRWFEFDPCWAIIRVLAAVGAVRLLRPVEVDDRLPAAEQPWGVPV